MDKTQRQWLITFIAEHDCLFEQWGVPSKITRLIRNLHAKSWCNYGDSEQPIELRIGGRQGCKFGSIIFNGSYSIALFMLHDLLLEDNIILRIPSSGPDFWCRGEQTNEKHPPDTTVVDVTFVDDECVMLSASTPKALDCSTDKLLCMVTGTFDTLKLEANWKPGKTECFLTYRGKNASKHYERRRSVDGSSQLRVKVPNSDRFLNVVDKY